MISIVVPTYHEAGNISLLLRRIRSSLTTNGLEYEVIIVDDDSRDGTDAVVSELRSESHPVRLITRHGDRGLSSAVLCGFLEARGDILVCMDADLSHPPERIPALVQCLVNEKCEFAVGSRYVHAGSMRVPCGAMQWLIRKVLILLTRPLTQLKDPISQCFALRRRTFERSKTLVRGGPMIALELILKCDCRGICEIPIEHISHECAQGEMKFSEIMAHARHLKHLFDFRYGDWSRFFQFCFVGSTGVIIDLTSFRFAMLVTSIPLARALAIVFAMTWNFWLNLRLTFSYSRGAAILIKYLKFVLSCSVGSAISWSISVSLIGHVGFFGNHQISAAVPGIIAGTFSNFFLSRYVVYGCLTTGLETKHRYEQAIDAEH